MCQARHATCVDAQCGQHGLAKTSVELPQLLRYCRLSSATLLERYCHGGDRRKTLPVASPAEVQPRSPQQGSLYTGITKDVCRRCEQHNAGTASRYTRSRLPVVLVYQEPQASQSLALKREAAIKTLSRLAKESLIQPPA